MTKYSYIFTLAAVFLIYSCGPSISDQNKELRAKVIAVHDEVMPQMGKLKNLEKQALNLAEELEANEEGDSIRVQELKALAYDLDQAHEGMFVWMRQYEQEDGERTPEEVTAYLNDQMTKVQKVKEDIKASLSKASSLLEDQ